MSLCSTCGSRQRAAWIKPIWHELVWALPLLIVVVEAIDVDGAVHIRSDRHASDLCVAREFHVRSSWSRRVVPESLLNHIAQIGQTLTVIVLEAKRIFSTTNRICQLLANSLQRFSVSGKVGQDGLSGQHRSLGAGNKEID